MTGPADREPRLCLPVRHWPPMDQALWRAAQEDLLAGEEGSRGDHKPISNRKVEKGYGRWLSWLAQTGQLDPDLPPGERITRDRAKAYIRDLARVNGRSTLLNRLQELHDAACAMAPGADWLWIRRMAAWVRRRREPDSGVATCRTLRSCWSSGST